MAPFTFTQVRFVNFLVPRSHFEVEY